MKNVKEREADVKKKSEASTKHRSNEVCLRKKIFYLLLKFK